MKKVILAVVIGISAISFVSCGNSEVNEDNIKDKYNVDEYIEQQNPISHSHLSKIREIIRSNIKDVNERISWSMPIYEKNGNYISFCAGKNK